MSKILGPLSLSFDPGSVTADHHWLERGQFFIYKLLQRPKHSFFKVLWVQYPTTTIQHPRLKMPWGMAGEWGDLKPSFALTRASQRPQRGLTGTSWRGATQSPLKIPSPQTPSVGELSVMCPDVLLGNSVARWRTCHMSPLKLVILLHFIS